MVQIRGTTITIVNTMRRIQLQWTWFTTWTKRISKITDKENSVNPRKADIPSEVSSGSRETAEIRATLSLNSGIPERQLAALRQQRVDLDYWGQVELWMSRK